MSEYPLYCRAVLCFSFTYFEIEILGFCRVAFSKNPALSIDQADVILHLFVLLALEFDAILASMLVFVSHNIAFRGFLKHSKHQIAILCVFNVRRRTWVIYPSPKVGVT